MMKRLKDIKHELLDLLPVGIFWKDKNSIYLGCNQYHAEHAGFKNEQELIGKADYDLPWRIMADKYRRDDLYVMNSGLKSVFFEEVIEFESGPVWSRTTKVPLYDDNGEVCGILGVWMDISEYKNIVDLLETSVASMVRKTQSVSEKLGHAETTLDSLDLMQ